MRNLDILKSVDFDLSMGADRHWSILTIDTLTPEVYVGHKDGFISASFDGKKNCDVNLRSEGILNVDDSADHLLYVEFLLDQQLLFFATKFGSLGTYDCINGQIECVGLISDGVETLAFSPDYDLLVIITKNHALMIMNREYESMIDVNLDSYGFGQDAFVTVGWGKKETQFHGSEGKEAAIVKKNENISPALSWDDKKIRICWRGDGQFFATSNVDQESSTRIIRIWTREGLHSTTGELTNGLEQSLCWRPSGNLIASSQQTPDEHRVIFYERNGLRHGEFVLPFLPNEQKVMEKDSTILAVWTETIDFEKNSFLSHLQFWTCGNYHWYLKKTFTFDDIDARRRQLVTFRWDPDNDNCIHLLTSNGRYFQHNFGWTTDESGARDPNAIVTVVDGANLLITLFAKAVVPPPFAATQIKLNGFCNFLTFNPSYDKILVGLSNNRIALYAKSMDKTSTNGDDEWSMLKTFCFPDGKNANFYHLRFIDNDTLSVVTTADAVWSLKFFTIRSDNEILTEKCSVNLPGSIYQVAVLNRKNSILVQFDDGKLMEINSEGSLRPFKSTNGADLRLPNACFRFDVVEVFDKIVVVALNERFQFFIDGKEIANNVNSFCLHDKFLLCTTLSHQLYCIPLEKLIGADFSLSGKFTDVRNLERGSRLVTVVAKNTKVIMQMPRGNLETIHPRPLVVATLKQMIDNLLYKDAMLMMKRHRIDMNLIYDHDAQKFVENIDSFVASVDDAMLFNLFLSDLKEENVTKTLYASFYDESKSPKSFPNKINDVCRLLRASFTRLDVGRRHFTSLLMTYVKTKPSELDAALQTIKNVRNAGGANVVSLVEEGLRHLLYMIDVNILIDVALGTYDFDLVLMAVEKSQKDPKEFLPFLNDLKKLDVNYRMYKIDVHLERFKKALVHLTNCGESRFDECLQFVKSKELYVDALKLYAKNSDEYKVLCCSYAAHLFARKKFDDAGLFYEQGGDFEKALDSYKWGLNWRMFFSLAFSKQIANERVVDAAKHIAVKLKDLKRFSEAAIVFSDFAQDRENSLKCLIDGGCFEECLQKIHFYNSLNYLNEIFLPGLKSYVGRTNETLTSRRRSYEQHFQRLRIVRRTKRENFEKALEKGDFDDALAEVYSEVSSTVTKTSGRASTKASSSRTKQSTAKKMEKKKLSLKENSAYEDLAILNELNEIVKQIDAVQSELGPVLRLLVTFGMIEEGKTCQNIATEFLTFIESTLDEIWPDDVDVPLLPGPLRDNIVGSAESSTTDDVVQRIQSGSMPNSIRFEPLLIRPRLRKDIKWSLEFLQT